MSFGYCSCQRQRQRASKPDLYVKPTGLTFDLDYHIGRHCRVTEVGLVAEHGGISLSKETYCTVPGS